MSCNGKLGIALSAVLIALAASSSAFAQKKYDTGASDTEIKIGNIMPYSGPASAYGVIGKTEEAYFKKINAEGGINGRKINFISYDDGYSPPKTIEQARKLVEIDQVLLVFNPLGTPGNTAIQRYLNIKKVPQLFVATGATKWNDSKDYPWTMGWQPNYQSETRIYAKYLLKEKPDAKIAVLFQNDDYGKDYLKGLKDGLGAKAGSMIVIEESYEVSQPTIDSNIVKLKSLNADVFVNITTPKFAAQAIKKMAEIGWKPLHLLNNVSSSVGSAIKPAGFDNAQDIISATYAKDATDPQWKNDPGIRAFDEFLAKYLPEGNRADSSVLYGYNVAQTLVHVLKQCGDNLTRENVMKQAANIKGLELGGLLPGIKLNTSATDFAPLEQLQLMKFKGEKWVLFGDVINGELGNSSTQPSAVASTTIREQQPAIQPPTIQTPVIQAQPRDFPVPSVSAPIQRSQQISRRVALVIGNSSYKNVPALSNPQRDAASVADALRRLGFQTVTLQNDLGKERLVNALRDFAQLAENADWSVVYYAGHGIEVGGVNYLIPVDAKLSTDRDIGFEAVPLDQVLNAAERASKLRLIILDACRDNPFANQMKRTLTVASRSVSRGLALIEPEAGTLVVYAAKHGETALDGDTGNSPFVTAFMKNLQTPGLEVRRMFDYVRDDVLEATNHRQKPYSYGSLSGRQDFYFVATK